LSLMVTYSYRKQINILIVNAWRMHLGFLIDNGYWNWLENIEVLIRKEKPLSFRFSYEDWYSKAIFLVKTLHPKALEEFSLLYINKNAVISDPRIYTISDFLFGNEIRRSHDYHAKKDAVKRNFEIQIKILEQIRLDLINTLS